MHVREPVIEAMGGCLILGITLSNYAQVGCQMVNGGEVVGVSFPPICNIVTSRTMGGH